MKKKKIVIGILIAAVIAIATSAVVYAYLISKDTKTNNIKLGYNKISIEENYDPPLVMAKGISYTKEPSVRNTGNVDCYVRVKAEVSDSRVADSLTIDYNTDDWTKKADGYWYYKEAIGPTMSTSPLFTTVTIAEDAPDLVLDGYDIFVYAESVQTVDGKTADQIWN